jgi:hypothetical protein
VIVSSSKQPDVELVSIPPPPTHDSYALVAKELCDLLSRLDVVIPRFGRVIACLLTEMKINGKSKKVGVCPQTALERGSRLGAKTRRVVT